MKSKDFVYDNFKRRISLLIFILQLSLHSTKSSESYTTNIAHKIGKVIPFGIKLLLDDSVHGR